MSVYFIQAGQNGPIKIGVGGNPRKRRTNLQIGNHERLRLLGTMDGDSKSERRLHSKFRRFLINGEWFSCCDEIKEFINNFTTAPTTRERARGSKEHALRQWIEAEGITQSEGAKRLGISDSHLSELIAGIKRPSMPLVADISRVTGGAVGVEDFTWPARTSAA